MLIANLLSYAHNIIRQLNSSKRETAKGLNAVVDNSSISCLLVVCLNSISILDALLLRGLIGEGNLAVITASNVLALAVFAVRIV